MSDSKLEFLEQALQKAGFRKSKEGNGKYHLGVWRGVSPIPRTLVVSLHTGAKGISMTCNDPLSLEKLLSGHNPWIDQRPVIWVDDALYGSPLGGILVGVMGPSKSLHLTVVPPEMVRSTDRYNAVRRAVQDLVAEAAQAEGLEKTSCVLEICTSHVFTETRRALREGGWIVRPAEIKGALQNALLKASKEHLRETYGLPQHIVMRGCQEIARYALGAGIPRTHFKWSFETGNGRFDPNVRIDAQTN